MSGTRCCLCENTCLKVKANSSPFAQLEQEMPFVTLGTLPYLLEAIPARRHQMVVGGRVRTGRCGGRVSGKLEPVRIQRQPFELLLVVVLAVLVRYHVRVLVVDARVAADVAAERFRAALVLLGAGRLVVLLLRRKYGERKTTAKVSAQGTRYGSCWSTDVRHKSLAL